MEYTERLLLFDAVELLSDRLDTLRDEQVITDATYNRKKAYKQLLRAINRADRSLAFLNKDTRIVSIYVPKDLHIIPMSKHDTYTSEQVTAVNASTVASVHPDAVTLQLWEEPWWDVVGIFSEISVYGEHVLSGYKKSEVRSQEPVVGTKLKQASGSGFNTPAMNSFYFDTKNRILHLSEALKENSFLVFEAFVAPSEISIRDYNVQSRDEAEETDLLDVTLFTETIHEDVLMDVALSKLLPGTVDRPDPRGLQYEMGTYASGNGASMFFVDEE